MFQKHILAKLIRRPEKLKTSVLQNGLSRLTEQFFSNFLSVADKDLGVQYLSQISDGMLYIGRYPLFVQANDTGCGKRGKQSIGE